MVLLHGFAADTNLSFVRAGLLDALVDEGCRAIATDFRGHGLSAKPHDPAVYAGDAVTRDVSALLDHLGLERAAVVGCSMGAGVALWLGATDARVERVVALGVGERSLTRGTDGGTALRDAFLADDPDTIDDSVARRFRRLADSVRADRIPGARALTVPGDHFSAIRQPGLHRAVLELLADRLGVAPVPAP